MPTYQYLCTECGARLEQVQRFTDAPLTECTACQGRLRKVYSAVGVVFKGSGFYHNDSRAKPAANGERDSKDGGKDGGESKADTGKADKTTTEAKTDGKGKSEAGGKSDRPKEGRGDRRGEGRGDRTPASTSGGSSSSRDSSPSTPASPATKSA